MKSTFVLLIECEICCHKKRNGKVYIEEKFTFSLKMSISFFIFTRFFPWVFRNSWRLNWMKWVDEKRNSLLSIFNAFFSRTQCFWWNSFRNEFPVKWMKRQFDRLNCKTTHKKNINLSLLGFLLINLYWIQTISSVLLLLVRCRTISKQK